eukprot:31074-Pelagococcus_subviridis.AAC.2
MRRAHVAPAGASIASLGAIAARGRPSTNSSHRARVAALPRQFGALAGAMRASKKGNSTNKNSPLSRESHRTSKRSGCAVAAAAYTEDGMGCAGVDDKLYEHEGHLKYRWQKFVETKEAIVSAEGSLEDFSKGHKKFGFNRNSNGEIVYREWAPAAAEAWLIGDFNGWSGDATPLTKDDFGVWTTTLPPDGIQHGSRVKIRMRTGDGGFTDRIPAWIKYSTAEAGVMGANYDGIFWDPPPGQEYVRKNPRPPRPAASRIYEAHVGMSGASHTLVPIRPRRRGERRSLRTFPGVSLRPGSLAFNPHPRRLSTPTDAFQLQLTPFNSN